MSEGFISRGFGGRRRKQSVGRARAKPPAPCRCTEELDGRILRPLPYSGPYNTDTTSEGSCPDAGSSGGDPDEEGDRIRVRVA